MSPLHNPLAEMELSPTQVNDLIDEYLKGLGQMLVVGELKSVSVSGPGHVYFSIHDPEQCVNCVTWASQRNSLRRLPDEGQLVRALVKNPALMNRSGKVLLNVLELTPLGQGGLARRAAEVVARLEAEGLFDRKRSLPYLPRKVGLVSGRDSDGLKDAVTSIHKRFPAQIVFCPARVQGMAAVQEIAAAISALCRDPEIDVIVIARGGGSPEDLAVFNEEGLARAVFACPKPVLTAIGHTNDLHVVDMVADRSVHVPSLIGEALLPDVEDLYRQLELAQGVLSAEAQADEARRRLDDLLERLGVGSERLGWQLDGRRRGLAESALGLAQGRERFVELRRQVDLHSARLSGLDAFGRGFALVSSSEGRPLTSATQLQPGQAVTLQLLDGRAQATIDQVSQSEEG